MAQIIESLKAMGGIGSAIAAIVGSGPVGWIVTGVLAIGGGFLVWILFRWLRGLAVKKANQQSEQNRNRNENETIEDGSRIERQNQGLIDRLIEDVRKYFTNDS